MPRTESIDFSEFNRIVDMDSIRKELTDMKDGRTEYQDVPDDKYLVRIAGMSIRRQKKDPQKLMVSVRFEILDGEYKGRPFFWNQNIMNGVGIGRVTEFLRKLDVFEPNEIEWHDDYQDFNTLILDVAQACDEDNRTYVVEYYHNDKGFAGVDVDKVL